MLQVEGRVSDPIIKYNIYVTNRRKSVDALEYICIYLIYKS